MSYWAGLRLEDDSLRYTTQRDFRAKDDRCDWCRMEDCPFAYSDHCPLDDEEDEADYKAYRAQVHGAMSGTSAF